MQTFLFLKPSDDAPINRIINIELLSHAQMDPDNPDGTDLVVGHTNVKLGMPLAKFIEQLERLIADNYRYSAQWHEKRMSDTEKVMISAMTKVHDH